MTVSSQRENGFSQLLRSLLSDAVTLLPASLKGIKPLSRLRRPLPCRGAIGLYRYRAVAGTTTYALCTNCQRRLAAVHIKFRVSLRAPQGAWQSVIPFKRTDSHVACGSSE